jgi:uncharacterized protein YbcV (DUF1398 family)
VTLIDTITTAQAQGAAARPDTNGFPVLAESLRRAGVTRIEVTVPAWTTVLTTERGSIIQQGAPMMSGSAEVPAFDRAGFVASLRAEQEGRLTYPEWMAATWHAGVVWYVVDLAARTCTYRSPAGDHYVEDYPAVELPAHRHPSQATETAR